MWNIYGKQYDLADFIDKHPGGSDILLKTKNERDITALFETYHAFSDKANIHKILNKYQINNQTNNQDNNQINNQDNNQINPRQIHDFTNYNILCETIKNETCYKSRADIKATKFWLFLTLMQTFFYILCFYIGIFSSHHSIFTRCIGAFFAGFFFESLGFIVMHDASHYGISVNPNINIILGKIWGGLALFNANIWFYHHVYNHHSFTSIENEDPDLYHLYPFMTKLDNSNNKFKPLINIIFKYQHLFCSGFLTIFPGQHLGQIYAYINTVSKSKIFKIKIINKAIFYDYIDLFIIGCMLSCLYYGLWLPTITYILSINFWYHINVVLDHDMYETSVDNHYGKIDGQIDWLRIQIQNSGNFMNQNKFWTSVFGGINYQIEHHLFPNMSNVHYPIISPIVKNYCKINNIPYNHHPTLLGAYSSYLKMMKYYSDKK